MATESDSLGEYNEWTFEKIGGPKGDWLCHLCQGQKVIKKITYTGGLCTPGFKLACGYCIKSDYGRTFFSRGCTKIIHETKISQ